MESTDNIIKKVIKYRGAITKEQMIWCFARRNKISKNDIVSINVKDIPNGYHIFIEYKERGMREKKEHRKERLSY